MTLIEDGRTSLFIRLQRHSQSTTSASRHVLMNGSCRQPCLEPCMSAAMRSMSRESARDWNDRRWLAAPPSVFMSLNPDSGTTSLAEAEVFGSSSFHVFNN